MLAAAGRYLDAVRRRFGVVMSVLFGCGVLPAAGPGKEALPGAASPTAEVSPALRAAIQAGVRRRGENEASFEVDSFVAALAVEEVAAGGGGIRVEPAIEAGGQVGYRVTAIAEGSAYAAIGLRVGDVVESISEVRLDSPGRAAGVLAASERAATVALVREGVGSTIELRLAGGLAWAELRGAGLPPASPQVQVVEDMPAGAGDEVLKSGGGGPVAVVPKARPGEVARPVRPGGAERPESGGGSGGASCATAASCTLDRRTFDAALASPEKVLNQVSIAPAKKGYKLTRVAAGSTVSALGFHAGDTIVSVNGSQLDDDMAALSLYMSLGSTRRYSVVYERNGVRATKVVTVEG